MNYSNNLKGSTHLGLRHWQPDIRPERLLTPPLGALSPIAWDRTILPGNACFLACFALLFLCCLLCFVPYPHILPAFLPALSSHFACFLACFALLPALFLCCLCLRSKIPVGPTYLLNRRGLFAPYFFTVIDCNKQRCPGGRFDHLIGDGPHYGHSPDLGSFT